MLVGDAVAVARLPASRSAAILRVRGDVWNDLDLSRGPTPSTGQPIFPRRLRAATTTPSPAPTCACASSRRSRSARPCACTCASTCSTTSASARRPTCCRRTRATPWPTAERRRRRRAASTRSHDAIRVKQAWGEVTLPFGVLSAGRMGALVSLGHRLLRQQRRLPRLRLRRLGRSHRADGADPRPLRHRALRAVGERPLRRAGGAADRSRAARAGEHGRALDRARRLGRSAATKLRAGAHARATTACWPATVARISTRRRGPSRAASCAATAPATSSRATCKASPADAWLLLHAGGFRAELEFATVIGRIGDATNSPGVSFRTPVDRDAARRRRFAVVRACIGRCRLRFEVGVASGDDAPGFGLSGTDLPRKGDLDGGQVTFAERHRPSTTSAFIPTITSIRSCGAASSARSPTASTLCAVGALGPSGCCTTTSSFEAAFIESSALTATTPPGQATHLGEEIDLSMRYRYEPAFEVGIAVWRVRSRGRFRNLDLNLQPQPAQALEVVLAYRL